VPRKSREIVGRAGSLVYRFAGVLGVLVGAVGTVLWVAALGDDGFLAWLMLGPLVFALSVGLVPGGAWPRYRHVRVGLATGVWIGYATCLVLVAVMLSSIGES
jgi:hypothetical protein